MKRKVLTFVMLAALTFLSACGAASTPTLSAADAANTAVALAWTELAMTQAALPTATPIPPTSTPLPTDTPFPTFTPAPTLAVNVPAASPTSGANPCNEPMPPSTSGAKTQVKFVNKSDGLVSLSFGLTQKNDVGECGIYGYTIGPNQSASVEVLTGCYWAFAYVTVGQKTSTAKSPDNICLEAGVTRGVTITTEWIGVD